VQQHPLEFDVVGHNHGAGAASPALTVAKSLRDRRGNPLSVVKNGLRIFVIAMLATRVDPSFLTGRLHRQGGIIFFLIALGAIFLLLWMVRRGEAEKPAITARGVF
jgi:hypothetical protein